MPVSTEAPRCSEFAREIGVLPPGSGLFLQRVVLATVPLPWPKPALGHRAIDTAAGLLNASETSTRLFAAEPTGPRTRVEVYERNTEGTTLHAWDLGSSEPLDALVAAIANAPLGSLDRIEADDAEAVDTPHELPPTFLVCTQGSHDICCGIDGVALADAIESERPDYTVRRVSHTGGHRFAPTFIAFPEGRMWAYADLELVDRIAGGAATPQDHRERARGWWGAPVGAAQAAECAVRAEIADRPFAVPSIEPVRSADGSTPTTFDIGADGRRWRVDVRVERLVPSIACEAPGGLPAKPGREFAWTIEQR